MLSLTTSPRCPRCGTAVAVKGEYCAVCADLRDAAGPKGPVYLFNIQPRVQRPEPVDPDAPPTLDTLQDGTDGTD